MKKILLQRGNEYRIIDKEDMIAHESLPTGTYVVKFDKMSESFYLERVENFILPDKIYGKSTRNAERVIHTFSDRPLTTGILLDQARHYWPSKYLAWDWSATSPH